MMIMAQKQNPNPGDQDGLPMGWNYNSLDEAIGHATNPTAIRDDGNDTVGHSHNSRNKRPSVAATSEELSFYNAFFRSEPPSAPAFGSSNKRMKISGSLDPSFWSDPFQKSSNAPTATGRYDPEGHDRVTNDTLAALEPTPLISSAAMLTASTAKDDEDPFCPLPLSHSPAWNRRDSFALVSESSLFASNRQDEFAPAVATGPFDAVSELVKPKQQQQQQQQQHPRPPFPMASSSSSTSALSRRSSRPSKEKNASSLDGSTPPPVEDYTARSIRPLATEEDANWLSDFLCFIRSDILEVFQATCHDVSSRANSKKIVVGQVGVRCRFCAHVARNHRARRAACFPSSVHKIYQSFTMMSRDHFGHCSAMPKDIREKYHKLKGSATQGAADSKRYWALSAGQLGMVDSAEQGIIVMRSQSPIPDDQGILSHWNPGYNNETNSQVATRAVSGAALPSLSRSSSEQPAFVPLVEPSDANLLKDSPYALLLVNQVDRVFLLREEILGNRRSLPEDLPGFGCKYCTEQNRKGKCRFFPARRRTLPTKLFREFHNHLLKCQLCPVVVKQKLQALKPSHHDTSAAGVVMNVREDEKRQLSEKDYLDLFWSRLHSKPAASASAVSLEK